MSVFQQFWAAQDPAKETPGSDSVTQTPSGASSASPSNLPASSNTGVEKHPSGAKASAAAAQGSLSLSVKETAARKAPAQQQPTPSHAMSAGEPDELRQQGSAGDADVAADMPKGSSSKEANKQGAALIIAKWASLPRAVSRQSVLNHPC